MSDIVVVVATHSGWTLIFYFDVLSDSLFHSYQLRGIGSREDFIITKAERDSDLLGCSGDAFLRQSSIGDRVVLKQGDGFRVGPARCTPSAAYQKFLQTVSKGRHVCRVRNFEISQNSVRSAMSNCSRCFWYGTLDEKVEQFLALFEFRQYILTYFEGCLL